MQITPMKLADLIPYEKNPRRNDKAVKYVAESIKKFGFKVPIVIDKDNVIIAGHTRFKAAKKLRLKEVPCIVADDLSEEQIKAFRLADNKVAEYSEWDFELLSIELDELINFDMEVFGFDMEDVLNTEDKVVGDDDYEVELPKDPISKRGQIYQLGKHRLMCGDSTNEDDVRSLMDGYVADITFTSPPYNAGTAPAEAKKNKKAKYKNDSDNKSVGEYTEFLNRFTENAISHSKYSFVNIQMLSNNKLSFIDYIHNNKRYIADIAIWDKQTAEPAIGKNVMNSQFEFVVIFSEKANRAIGTKEFRGTISNVISISKHTRNEYADIHNATFPIDFAGYFVKHFANESVLDLFGGTGTTLIASEQLNKRCFMMEYDPLYVDVIIDRWEQYTGQKAVLIEGVTA